MKTYQVETLNQFLPDFIPTLMETHYDELTGSKELILDPNYDLYYMIEAQEKLHIFTMREDGELIGYHLGIIDTGLHYKQNLFCLTDIYYVRKDYRQGVTGYRFFKKLEPVLKDLATKKGYDKLFWQMPYKVFQDHSNFFVNGLGFKNSQEIVAKTI